MAEPPQARPEVTAAIVKGSIVDGILVALGTALFFFTGQVFWIFGAVAIGGAVFVLLLAQAGAFKQQ